MSITISQIHLAFTGPVSQDRRFRPAIARWLRADGITALYKLYNLAALSHFGLATHEDIELWRWLLGEWRDNPAASGAIAFGEAIATKP